MAATIANDGATRLPSVGCDVGQGYLYAKPMAKAQLIAAMRRRLVGGAPVPVALPKRRLSGLIPGWAPEASCRSPRPHVSIPHL